MDLKQAKKYMPDYLERIGVKIHRDGNRKKILCQNPFHAEKKPSAQLNDTGIVNCYGCSARYDVFDLIGWNESISGLGEQIKRFTAIFGAEVDNLKQPHEVKPVFRGWVKRTDYVSLEIKSARSVYRVSQVLRLMDKCRIKDPVFDGAYPYLSDDGKVDAVDFRILSGNEKQVITVWFDGRNLKTRNPPNLIWGLDHLDYEKPALIVEGAKCAKIAHDLLGDAFSVHTWNRGTAGAIYCNWEKITGFERIYFLADADRKRMNSGDLVPLIEQVGTKCMIKIAENINEINENCKIKVCEAHECVLGLKTSGGDIEEMKQLMTKDEIVSYILRDGKDFYNG